MAVKPAELFALAEARGQMRETQILSSKTRFWFYPAVGKSKGSIVFVHGFRGAHDGLHAIIAELTDFDCYGPDIPGYGLSEPARKPHDLNTYSEWLGEFIKALNLPSKPTVIGHSFGTMIVAAHAAEQLGDIGKVVLINPVSKPSLQGPRRFISMGTGAFFWFTSKFGEKGSRFFVDSWAILQFVSSTLAKTKNRELRNWIHKQHHSTMKNYAASNVMYESYQASVDNCVEQFAPKIINKTLLIAGEFDDITSVAQQQEVAQKYSSAKLVVIPGVGHLTHYEKSTEAAELIRKFLTEEN